MIQLLKNQIVRLYEVEYIVISGTPELNSLLENKATGERISVSNDELTAKYLTGEFCPAARSRAQLKEQSASAHGPARMDNMSVVAKQETHRRLDYLVRLDKVGAFSMSKKGLAEAIHKISLDRKDAHSPHISTIHRWKRKYRQARNDVRALFAAFDARGGKGGYRLHPAVEALIDKQVDEIALKQRRCTAQEVHDALRLAVGQENSNRPKNDQLRLPSLRTVQRRMSMLAEFDLMVARTSLTEARRKFALHGTSRPVCRLLEIVEIDHSPVDIMVVGEDRETIGRPTITVIVDRASRCVLGYHLSLAGHGVPAVFESLRHALLPKTYLTERYADLGLSWECFGWPEWVLMDNGREFHADAIADALLNLGIGCEYAASRTPNDKPFVERFLRTLNYCFIHTLRGTTLDKAHKRVGFKPENDAVLTLTELDRLIHVWICSVYHKRPHRGLEGRAPINVWRDLAKKHPPQLKMNAADIDIEFSELAESKVQTYGIDLNTFVYRNERLLVLGSMLPAGKKSVTVKWPRNDVGYIWVWDVTAQEFFKVTNTKEEYAGLTLEQAKVARKIKSTGDPSYEQTRAEAGAISRAQVETSMHATKLAKRRKGARLGNVNSAPSREPQRFVAREFEHEGEGLVETCCDGADAYEETFQVDLPISREDD
jgi:putative transposase